MRVHEDGHGHAHSQHSAFMVGVHRSSDAVMLKGGAKMLAENIASCVDMGDSQAVKTMEKLRKSI